VASLSDYDEHIANKVQLLLDATLGLINVEQNNIIKVLTIVAVVGIPPTLIASMYGMNFKGMPEYDWAWGYPYALAMIALSAVLPLVWFKWRGWTEPSVGAVEIGRPGQPRRSAHAESTVRSRNQ